ncbi:Caspase-14 [Manis javanica]|nr:Caspase-14 [Manis javanica]
MTTRRKVLGSAATLAMGGLLGCTTKARQGASMSDSTPEVIFHNGRFTTLNKAQPTATAVAVKDGRFIAVGSDAEGWPWPGSGTAASIAAPQRAARPVRQPHARIRGGLNFNLELRWDGVRSLADALDMLKRQVAITPAPQWPAGGEITRDANGNPTGLLLAKPNATILYSTLAKGPKLPLDYQVNSTRHFMRELNRLGVTGGDRCGRGFQNYPDDYDVIQKLSDANQITVRLAYNLFTQKPKRRRPTSSTDAKREVQAGQRLFPPQRRGEMLVYSAADFGDFRQPRPDMPQHGATWRKWCACCAEPMAMAPARHL